MSIPIIVFDIIVLTIQAAAKYASDIYDPKTHIVPALVPGDELLASVILFYDSPNTSYPEIFKPFTDIPAISSTLGFKTVSEFAAETGAMVVPNIKYVQCHQVHLFATNRVM